MSGKVFFLILLLLLANAIVSGIYHKQKKLNIYYDFTDAILTVGALVSPVIVGIIFGLLTNSTIGTIMGWLTFAGGLVFVYRSSHVNNINVKYALMSAFTKYFVVLGYVLLMLMNGGKPPKREGESDVAYEIRSHNAAVSSAITSAIFTALFTWFTYSMTRIQQFGELGQYFVFDFNRKPFAVMFNDCEDEDIEQEQYLIEDFNCSNCGATQSVDVKFCSDCGTKLIAA